MQVLRRTPRNIAIGIFVLALFLRIMLLADAADSPYAGSLLLDAEEYQHLAQSLLDGNWQAAAAQTYVHGILFPVLWAAILWLCGGIVDALSVLLLVQAVLGAATCVLLYAAARHLLGPTPAIICGLLASTYWPFLVFGIQPLATTLVVFLVAALLAWMSRPGALTTGALMGAGLLLALLGATRANALLLLPVVAWLAVLRSAEGGHSLRRTLLPLAAGLGVGLAPFLVHNLITQGTPLPFEGAWSLHMGNNPAADGTPYARQGLDWQRLESIGFRDGWNTPPARRGSIYLQESIHFWTTRPTEALQLTWTKLRLFWHAYEVPVSIDLDWYARNTVLGRMLPITFGLLAPLALLGMVFNRQHWRRLLLVYGGVVAFLLSGLLFTVCARYRLPAVPFLLLFAADALHRLVGMVQSREPRSLIAPAAILLVAAVIVHTGVDPARVNHLRPDWLQGDILLRNGQLEQARAAFARALERDPLDADVLNSVAATDERLGRTAAAEAGYRKALKVAPDHSRAAVNLARLLGRTGRGAEAMAVVDGALATDPRPRMQHEALLCRGTLRLRAGDMSLAYDDMHAALAIMDGAQARYNLANVCHQLDRIEEELEHLERAVTLQPSFGLAHQNLGSLQLMRGDLEAAEQSLKRAIALEPEQPTAHAHLSFVYERSGRPEMARAAMARARRLRDRN